MEYRGGTESVTMMAIPHTAVTRWLSLARDPQVKRIRQNLMIVLGICLVSVSDSY